MPTQKKQITPENGLATAAATPETRKRHRGRPTREQALEKAACREQADFLAGCTVDERAYCVRLIRLLRDKYWVTEFVREILDRESRSRWNWTVELAKKSLANYETLEALASNARRIGNTWSNHPVLRAVRREFDNEIADYMDDRRVRDLIASASKK
jgi:hypothetical protein